MSLFTNSRFFSLIWWILAPALVGLLFNSIISFVFKDKNSNIIKIEHQRFQYLKNYPKFLSINGEKNKKSKLKIPKVDKFGKIVLKACYAEKNKKFIVFKESQKTIFLDLNKKYKGAILVDVGIDYAIFSKDGKKIELKIEKIKKANRIEIRTEQMPPEDKYISVKRESFKKYTQNIRQALRDVRIQELTKKKKFAGIKLSFIRRGSLFDKMKLRVGDIIKSIDGNKLKSMMDLLPYYNRINDTATLQIGFERNNEMKEIIYEIN